MLIGVAEAGRILSLSPALVRYRAEHGHLPIARRSPLRFYLDTVLRVRETMAPKLVKSEEARAQAPGR